MSKLESPRTDLPPTASSAPGIPIGGPAQYFPDAIGVFWDKFYLRGLFVSLIIIAVLLSLFYGPSRTVKLDGKVLLTATPFGAPTRKIVGEMPELPPPTAEKPAQVGEFYRGILTGEQGISLLARTYGLSIGTMLSVNKIEDLSRIRPGFKYLIPGGDGVLHEVSRGQTLDKIADFYGVSKNELAAVNGLVVERLRDGQELFIPNHELSDEEVNRIVGKSYLFPVPGRVVRTFGKVHNSLTDTFVFNDGIDIETNPEQEVYAAYEGRVVRGGLHSLYGYYIILEHKGYIHTFYGYLRSVELQIGERVERGSVIGRVGPSGYTNGQTLHFSILHKNKPVNPFKYLR